MPRKKNIAAEMISPDPRAKPTKGQIVNARHTVVYEAPQVVEIPIDEHDEETAEVEFIEEQEQTQRQPSFRTKIRDRFKARGIGVDEALNLRVDRMPLYEQNGLAGMKADREFCSIIPCMESFFEGDEYLKEIQRRHGPGEYWLIVRHKNSIVAQWRERIGGFPVAPVVTTSENGQPQIIYQQPGQPPAPQPTVKDHLREIAETIKLVDSIRGPREENPAPQPAMDPEAVLLSSLATNDKFMDRIGKGVIGKLVGGSVADDDPSWTSVAMKAIETGQATTIVQTIIREIVAPFRNTWSQPNGQAQMAQAPLQNHGAPSQNQGERPNANIHAIQGAETQPQGAADMAQAGPPTDGQQQPTPADHALMIVVNDCARRIPPQVTFTNLITFADEVNKQAPVYTIDGWIRFFADMPIDGALEFVKTLPNGPQVVALPHARAWTQELQKLFKENQTEESEAT
jgi:hypothetical protein